MIKIKDDVLKRILEPYKLEISELSFLGGGRDDSDGITYSYSSEGNKMVFKIIAWEESEEEFEHKVQKNEERLSFVRFAGQKGANIVYPALSSEGKLYHKHYEDGAGYISYIMEYVSGNINSPNDFNGDLYLRWGKAIGKMHSIAKQYPLWKGSNKLCTNGLPILSWETEWNEIDTLHYDDDVRQKWSEIHSSLSKLPQDRDVFGFTHNDPHYMNVLDDGKTLFLIDFDAANYHLFINDIAISLQSIMFSYSGGLARPLEDKESLKRFLSTLLEGYRVENQIDNEWIKQLDLFVAYRRVMLFAMLKEMITNKKSLYDSWKGEIMKTPKYVLDCLF